jgi:hypothetical protein
MENPTLTFRRIVVHVSGNNGKRRQGKKRIDVSKTPTIRTYRHDATGETFSIARSGRDVCYSDANHQSSRNSTHLSTHVPDEACGEIVSGTFQLTIVYRSTSDNHRNARNVLGYHSRNNTLQHFAFGLDTADATTSVRLFPVAGASVTKLLSDLDEKIDGGIRCVQSIVPASTGCDYRNRPSTFDKKHRQNDRLISDANLADAKCPDTHKRIVGIDGRFAGKKPIVVKNDDSYGPFYSYPK